MRHGNLFAVVSLAITFLAENTSYGGNISYAIVDYPSAQAGWTVSGTITTDGTIGENALTGANIIAWNFTLSSSAGTFSTDSTQRSTLFSSFTSANNLSATATALYLTPILPNAVFPNVPYLQFGAPLAPFDNISLGWERGTGTNGNNPDLYNGGSFFTLNQDPTLNGWSTHGPTLTAALGGPSDDWLIAGVGPPFAPPPPQPPPPPPPPPVPEPASSTLLGVGVVCLAGYRKRRKIV